jgi:hypothetical protein
MAVALGVAGTHVAGGAVATLTTGSFTTGASVTALLGVLSLAYSSTAPTGVGIAWNTTGTMTNLIGPIILTGPPLVATYFFGLVNPAITTSTAKATWTTSTTECYLGLISFTGTDTTTPFINTTSITNQTGGTSASLTVTIPASGAGVCLITDDTSIPGSTTGTGVTSWWNDSTTQNCAAGYAIVSVNTAFAATVTSGDKWQAVGVAVQPPASLTLNMKSRIFM